MQNIFSIFSNISEKNTWASKNNIYAAGERVSHPAL